MLPNEPEENDLPPPNNPRELPLHPRSVASLGKRSRGYSYGNSSDTPCFSSDDLEEACIENYAVPRKKTQHRRTWWESDSIAKARKEKLIEAEANTAGASNSKKAIDSGVFLASDNASNSSGSNDDGFITGGLNAQNLRRHGKRFSLPAPVDRRESVDPSVDPDSHARRVIQACLEANQEDVDLTRSELSSLSNQVIKPLRNLIRTPKFHQDHQVDDAYRPFTPELKLFLAMNQLRSLPNEIVNLEHLTVLSLRNNKLTALPHSFGRLRNLKDLNIAGNRLTWLPWELLDLCGTSGKLENLYLRPNPLITPLPTEPSFSVAGTKIPSADSQSLTSSITTAKTHMESLDSSPKNDIMKQKCSWVLRFLEAHLQKLTDDGSTEERKRMNIRLGSTAVTYYDFDGSHISSTAPAPSALPRDAHTLPLAPSGSGTSYPPGHPCAAAPGVPSLFELALRLCSDHLDFAHTDKDLPDSTPELVVRMLEAARNASEDGGTLCSVCQKRYIVPRAEWIEYWHSSVAHAHTTVDELFYPFLRRACTWTCAVAALSDAAQ